jgi:hypothetical protein
MKQLLILMSAVVGCKKVEVIENQAQIERDGYSVVATIKGNTIYRVLNSNHSPVYIVIRDSDSVATSIAIP